MSNPNIVLNVNGIEVIYNHVILVLKGVSLSVAEGQIAAILGGNGAGKTTTLRAISNLLKAERGEVTKGSVELRGERIENMSPADLVKRGVVQVMEGRHCFAHLSIEENLLTGNPPRARLWAWAITSSCPGTWAWSAADCCRHISKACNSGKPLMA